MRAILLILTAASLLFGAYTRDATTNTVYDDATGLTWQDDGSVTVNPKTWSDAIDYCENLDFAGKQDWRLPNFNELYMIADRSRVNPAIDPVFQDVTSGNYWSSTTGASGSSGAWAVDFYGGDDNWLDKTGSYYVRCVRSGQIAPSTPSVSVPLSPFAKAVMALLFVLGASLFMRRERAA